MAANSRSNRRHPHSGKKLIDRIVPVGRSLPKREPAKEGFKVVNGRLVGANDVGALLREASSTVENRKRRNRNAIGNSRDPSPNKSKDKKKGKRLVISTHSEATNKLLVLQNLALGVNQESLKIILQKLSHARISKVRVKDLPSGSATASVWLAHPTVQELERVRRLFDGALVDGRIIQVVTMSDTQTMSY
ncbi:uncharacterized protein ZBAI_02937 [Zygosaccharomyces bailii ISA1307]|uniref:ZYBA0S16-01134g1_1 n=1 Tax=Zygosaccharomyces bailii (strain CLIB 213 / ATCC 58445 / CBS 680 / BCRC 21525 / NBRC 1098 / NCYC 1416 / NRRL Y-2227) TaxID=1333698 RepID=A0A8J2TBR7_ZYGB2|nr:ZYBA0S16-01134g1_1 [Zygosaccharomyces bailii CLIB 213]CDH11151.1 uncharacterized protein ZBAI_02937 [Zygosaccharomyces bailii ISA1307]